MIISILQSAENDLLDGYHFYEKQRPELGNYFLDSQQAFRTILSHALKTLPLRYIL